MVTQGETQGLWRSVASIQYALWVSSALSKPRSSCLDVELALADTLTDVEVERVLELLDSGVHPPVGGGRGAGLSRSSGQRKREFGATARLFLF